MTTALREISNGIADLVALAATSILRVEARNRIPASGIAWSGEGIVLTSHHVVEDDDGIRVGLHDGSEATASLVGRDPATDLAVLRIDKSPGTIPTWAGADDFRVGSLAVAVGRPFHSIQASLGALSTVGGAWRTYGGARVDLFVRPDIVMYPGFSGGALVLGNGSFGGLNTSGLLRDANVTIPPDTLHRVVDTILVHGRVPYGYLGVGVQPVRIASAQVENAGSELGLMIMSVEEDSPASRAGVRQGDMLLSVDGRATTSPGDLRLALAAQEAGTAVVLRIVRGDEAVDLTAELELR